MDEKVLIKRLQRNDTDAFEELFYQYHKKVFNFSKQILGSHEKAEEITQEVFTAIWQNRSKIDHRGSFVSYIFKITRNQINNSISKSLTQKAYLEYVINQNEKPQIFTENQVLFDELSNILQHIINNLPPKRRKIYQLHRENGLSYKEIANELDISENTVDTQLRKALETIRNGINREYNFEL